MSQVETVSRNLPVPIDIGARRWFARGEGRGTPRTEFLSQLIAEHQHLPAQRARRRATPMEVLRGYDAGGKLKILRMPPGYQVNFEV